MSTVKYRLKGNESFGIREGWITKGLMAVKQNPNIFMKYGGADILGVGSNMAKSIRYWLRSCGLITEQKNHKTELSILGDMIYYYDPYLDDIFTLWILHIQLVRNKDLSTVWYLFFHKIDIDEFTKEELFTMMRWKLIQYIHSDTFSDKSLYDDCLVLLQMYSKEREKFFDPEDKKTSPFSVLGLIKKNGDKFCKRQPPLDQLDKYIVLYMIVGSMDHKGSILIEDLLNGENGIRNILQINRYSFEGYLDQLEEEGYITINRTAGLDMVYRKNVGQDIEIIKEYYEQKLR